MHGKKRNDFYQTYDERQHFKKKLEEGYRLLDSFVDYVYSIEKSDPAYRCEDGHQNPDDNRMFELSLGIIEFMPEFPPAWDYRKKYFLKMFGADSIKSLSRLLEEREYNQKILNKAPKSYALWHHRLWVITLLFNLRSKELYDVLMEEITLCFKLFKLDGRNFHCWSYFNFISHYIMQLDISEESKDNTTSMISKKLIDLINSNFSNYSAWYHRSNLKILSESHYYELELIKQAIYTDPHDQCLWNYYNWLLFERGALKQYIISVSFSGDPVFFVVYFNERVNLLAEKSHIYVTNELGNLEDIEGVWFPIDSNPPINNRLPKFDVPSFAWKFIYKGDVKKMNNVKMEITYVNVDNSGLFYSHLQGNKNFSIDSHAQNLERGTFEQIKLIYHFPDIIDGNLDMDLNYMEVMVLDNYNCWVPASDIYEKPIYLESIGHITSIGKFINMKILEKQLEMIDELMSLDPECKYLILFRVNILEFLGHKIDYDDIYTKISRIDTFRKSYYNDMLSQSKIRSTIKRVMSDGINGKIALRFFRRFYLDPVVDLSNMGISTIGYKSILPYFSIRSLNLSGNNICDRTLLESGIPFLLSIQYLDLSDNKMEDLLHILGCLKHLNSVKM